ncbi:M48 family metallopeptidase [Natrialbaceae archaeon A-arb3/5]
MGRLTRLHLGLWVRMAIASALAISAQLLVLAAEFAFIAFATLILLFALGDSLAFGFTLSLVGLGAFACWWLIAAAARRLLPVGAVVDRVAHGGLEDVAETVGRTLLRPGELVDPRWLAVALVGTFAGFVAVESIAWSAVVEPLWVAAAVGVVAVGAHLAWVAYTEWISDAAALRDLSESVRATERLPDDFDADRARVRARVDRLARQAGVPAPTVRLGTSPTPTAATVGYRPASSTVVVSAGLIDVLDDDELDAVLAHELAHLQNRDATIVTALSMPAAYATELIERYDGHPLAALPGGLVIVLIRWCVAVVSRYREYLADRGAVAITCDPAALASALETLDRDLERRPGTDLREHSSAAAFSIVPPPWEEHRFFDRTRRFIDRTIFGTHPKTATRIERLRS